MKWNHQQDTPPFQFLTEHIFRLYLEVIRRVPRPTQAHRIVAILDAFQTNDWSARVDGPSREFLTGTDLHAAIRSLNQTLTKIRFHSDGTGTGISWKVKSR